MGMKTVVMLNGGATFNDDEFLRLRGRGEAPYLTTHCLHNPKSLPKAQLGFVRFSHYLIMSRYSVVISMLNHEFPPNCCKA